MQHALSLCDDRSEQVDVLGMLIKSLEYADDAALFNKAVQAATERLTRLAAELNRRADMVISVEKLEVVQARRQPKLKVPKQSEYLEENVQKLLTHRCESAAATASIKARRISTVSRTPLLARKPH